MRAVNLLPASRRPGHRSAARNQARNAKAVVAGAGGLLVLTCVLVAAAGLQGRSVADGKQRTLVGLQQELAAAQASSAAAAQVKAQLQARFVAVSMTASGRVPWDGLLFDLSRVMPRDSWLSNLTVQTPEDAGASSAPGAPPATTGASMPAGFLITGFARSQNVIPLVLERLALVPRLSNVGLQRSQLVDVGKRKAVQFTIEATLSLGGGN